MNSNYGFGFHTAPFELFFKEEPNYAKIGIQSELLDIFAEMTHVNVCILDFYKHNYYFVSKNHFFMCGHSMQDTKVRGELLAHDIIYETDRQNQLHMKNAACLFFASLSPEEQLKTSLFTNHRLRHKNGSVFMVSNQYKPITFDDNGKMWIAMCITSIATKNIRVETFLDMPDGKTRYIYSPQKKAFVKVDIKPISPKEKVILLLSAQGFSVKEIAKQQNISESTVKFHRQNIMAKFNVQNISEAVFFAEAHKIL